jgi:hypothetical protein
VAIKLIKPFCAYAVMHKLKAVMDKLEIWGSFAEPPRYLNLVLHGILLQSLP